MQSVKRHVGHSFLCVLKECTVYSVSRRAKLARRCINGQVNGPHGGSKCAVEYDELLHFEVGCVVKVPL